MSNPERARDRAIRFAGTLAAIGFDAMLSLIGPVPKLRPPAFDEAEAQRFLSDGAEQLAVAEERDEVSEPVYQTVKCPQCDHVIEMTEARQRQSFNCPGCDVHMLAVRDYTPSNPAGAARPPKPSTGGATNSAPGSRSEAPVAADAPGPFPPVRAVDPGQPTSIPGTIIMPNWEPTDRSGLRYPLSEHPLYAEIQDQADAAIVLDVLAEHYYRPADHSSIGIEGHCGCGGRPIDLRDWQEHVAPLIVAALQQ